MIGKSGTVIFFASLLGSTLCVIPEGEIQIGPVFGQGSRIFGGNKYFELGFEKGGDLKHVLAKKALLGVGVLGAGAAAVGGAALIAKKFPHLHQGWGWSGSKGYGHGHGHSVPVQSYGWENQQTGGYYQGSGDIKYPASSYPSSNYPSSSYPASSYPDPSSSYYGSSYPSTSYGYPQSQQNDWQVSSGGYGGSSSFGGWSR